MGPNEEKIVEAGLIESEAVLKERFLEDINKKFTELGLKMPGEPGMKKGDGRAGVHTEDLEEALAQLSEVYALNPAVPW